MIEKDIDTSVDIYPLISSRWSGVAYAPDKAVSTEAIKSMAEAARWAPSCFGDQPWRVLFCNKHTDPVAWDKAFQCLAEGNQPWCQYAPVLAILCADSKFTKNDNPNGWGKYDTGAAALSICLQARAMDMMTHQMAGFSPEKASDAFAIPGRYEPVAMMTIGFQAKDNEIPKEFRERELAPRSRRPLGEMFFQGEWGKGL